MKRQKILRVFISQNLLFLVIYFLKIHNAQIEYNHVLEREEILKNFEHH